MTDTNSLKPCQKCGGKTIEYTDDAFSSRCEKCNMEFTYDGPIHKNYLDATRPITPALPARPKRPKIRPNTDRPKGSWVRSEDFYALESHIDQIERLRVGKV